MTASPIDRIVALLDNPRQRGNKWEARCPVPAHVDRKPSFAVWSGDNGAVLFCCQGGCAKEDILSALGLTWADLFPDREPGTGKSSKIVDRYPYRNETGELLFEVVRLEPKSFRQRRPDGAGGWLWKGDTRRVLYRLPEVLAAVEAGDPVFVVEGERDVHALEAAGYVATCNPGGAGKWRPEFTEALRGADVVVVADRDAPGRAHARTVAGALEGVATSVRCAEAREDAGKDVADHLAKGLGVEELVLIEDRWTPPPAPAAVAVDPVSLQPRSEGLTRRLRSGGAFILDQPPGVPAVWGEGDQVVWSAGEPFLVVGPPGVGKTTLVGQLVWGRLGLLDSVLGWPIAAGAHRVLYLACDRPRQISRALGRLASEDDRAVLDDRLVVWEGPPPHDLAKHPDVLWEMADEVGADTVIIDSLKDVAIGLSDDEVGAGLNRAMQRAIAEGVEVVALHHQRKGQGGTRPKALEDVYGSTWITAGAGSVVLLWGAAGDLIVDLEHLKQPAAQVGPLKVEHDHDAGTSVVHRGFDALRYLRLQPRGVTALEVARQMFEQGDPTDNQQRKARRDLERLCKNGMAHREGGGRGGDGGTVAARYYPVAAELREAS